MSQRKPIIASNPKPIESYMEMFSLIFEYADEFETAVKNALPDNEQSQSAFFKYFINKTFGQKSLAFPSNTTLRDYTKYLVTEYFFNDWVLKIFSKNNQVETLAKIFRTSLSRNIILIHYSIETSETWTLERLESKIKNEKDRETMDYWKKQNPKLQSIVDKIFSRYYNLTEVNPNFKSLDFAGNIIDEMRGKFNHIYSVVMMNPNFKRKFDKLDFKGMRLSEIYEALNELEKEIDESRDSSLVYEGREEIEYQKLLKAEENKTSLFIKIDDTYSWYLIDDDSSRLEAFIGSKGSGDGLHCGTPSQEENCLLSLRSLNEKGQFILHATCASHRVETDNGDFIYQLTEMRSRRNQPIKPELWPYMYALYADERIVSEGSASYAEDRSFSFNWFKDLPDFFKYTEKEKVLYGKMYNEIKNNKPFINDFNKAMSEYCLLSMTKKYAINIIEQTYFFSFLSREIIQEILSFYDVKDGFIYLQEYIQFSNIKNLLKGESSDFILQRIIDQKFDEESDSFKVLKKLKSKLKKKKLGKNQLLKVINKYVQIERGIIAITIEDEHTLRHYMDLEGSGLDWYFKTLEDPFYEAEQFISDHFNAMIYPENNRKEVDTNLREVLDYLKEFEERTNIQVYSPIVEDYNKTEMILSLDEHFYENIIKKRNSIEGDFGDFAEAIFDAITEAYSDSCRIGLEYNIQKSILEGLDGIELVGYHSENALCEFSTKDTKGIIDVIFRIDKNNIEAIMENDFELEKLDSIDNKRINIDIDYYYEFNFDNFTELLHDKLYEKFA